MHVKVFYLCNLLVVTTDYDDEYRLSVVTKRHKNDTSALAERLSKNISPTKVLFLLYTNHYLSTL